MKSATSFPGPVSNLPAPVHKLVAHAFAHHGARCLWNILRPHTMHGVRVVTSALRRNGDMRAWWLAARIDAIGATPTE